MRIYNKLILLLILAISIINVSLAFLRQNDIQAYFIADAIAYLVITQLYAYLNPRAKGSLNTVSLVIFIAFLVMVALKVISIIDASGI